MAHQLFSKTYNEVEACKPNGIPRYLTAELSWMLLELNKFWKNAWLFWQIREHNNRFEPGTLVQDVFLIIMNKSVRGFSFS